MGVVFQLGLAITAISIGLELFIIKQLRPDKFDPTMFAWWSRPFMRQAYKLGPWIDKSSLHSLSFSIVLSLVFEKLFPAVGMAMFIGGVGSSVVLQMVYYKPRNMINNAKAKLTARKEVA